MNSNELKLEWKKTNDYKYSKKQRLALHEDAIGMLGIEKLLAISIEEIAELIDVISENMCNKVDYMHTLEELADVKVCMEYIRVICNIDDRDIKHPKKKKIGKNKIFPIISSLTYAQRAIVKYIRCKKDSYDKVVVAYNSLNENITVIQSFFKIKDKDVDKMMNIKTHRLEERIIYNTLT